MTFTPSPRRAPILVMPGLAAALVFAGITGAALAQDRTVVIGNRGASQVQVDLSVLDGGGGVARGRQRDLLFPGSDFRPGQRIILRRPGTRGTRTRLRQPRLRPARRTTRRAVATPPPVVTPTAKPAIKSTKKMPAPAEAKATVRRRAMAEALAPPRATPKPKPRASSMLKSRATANLKAPPLAPPAAMSKPKPAAAPPRAAIPPMPAPPKAVDKPIPAPARIAPPPAMPPPVAPAPRASVTPAPLAKSTPAKTKRPSTQISSIPRPGAVATGSRRQILFAPGSARLEADGLATLAPISAALAKNPKLRVELKAYARGNTENVSQARRLSLSRALAVRAHLIGRGVKATRIDVRALGSKITDGVPNRVDLLVFTR